MLPLPVLQMDVLPGMLLLAEWLTYVINCANRTIIVRRGQENLQLLAGK